MKQVTEPGTLLNWNGDLYRVVSIGEGKTIHMTPVDKQPCPTCGNQFELRMLEHSPLFQDGAEPVPTLKQSVNIANG